MCIYITKKVSRKTTYIVITQVKVKIIIVTGKKKVKVIIFNHILIHVKTVVNENVVGLYTYIYTLSKHKSFIKFNVCFYNNHYIKTFTLTPPSVILKKTNTRIQQICNYYSKL